jgi:hypothetical protein
MFPSNVQPRRDSRMAACTGSNIVPNIRGLGGEPCATPRLSMHAALLPNLLTMTRKEPLYIRRNTVISSWGKPFALRTEKIALWFTALKAFLISRFRMTYRLSFRCRCSARILCSFPYWRFVLICRRNPSWASSTSPWSSVARSSCLPTMERRRENLAQMQATGPGRKSDIRRADNFLWIQPATAPAH